MFNRVAMLFAIAALCAGATSLAQSPNIQTTPIPAAPKPDWSQMQFLSGTWTCSTMSSRRPGPYTTTSTASMDPAGYWMITRTTTHKASWIPTEFTSEDRMTFDPSTSRWIDISYDPQGGYNVATSPGWKGNSIVWTDAVIQKSNNTASTNPTTMTKESDTKTSSSMTFTEPSGRVVSVKTTCTKGG